MDTRVLVFRVGYGLIAGLWLWSSLQGANEYLAQANLGVWFLLAPTLIAAKLRRPRISWLTLWMGAGAGGWLSVGFGVSAGPPSGSPFGEAFTLLTGWVYLLPVFGILAGIHRLMLKGRTWAEGGILARWSFPVLLGISVTIVTVALFTWTPRSGVEATARRVARDLKLGEVSGLQSHRTWKGWVVDLEVGAKGSYPVFFSRGGNVMGWSEG